ncbi:hypothetical protein RIF29_39045 [Crotalaria pallida]|uniref:Uncharacterized protein n=1 Tax=Crotalaria pallida TaxID=3830 RepID=A0AAN9E281_CROPI
MECERERPHRTTTSNNSNSNSSGTSELFVCFTSRLSSSSSMKLSSKSILSPSRSREPPQISLQSSLSRRLRNNGSIKGGQASPMFPTTTNVGGGKRRGCGFENPEPSSPKVTCIGQVRVKTKKQGKKMRSRSKRRGAAGSGGGEALSFRRSGGGAEQNPDLVRQNSQSFQYLQQQECLKHRNQRWVHIPLTICEALREFSCFFPCKSSCISKEDKGERSNDENGKEASCGAAFARWLVALQEGDGKGREIELVMREEEEEEEGGDCNNNDDNGERSCYRQRRHVLEDIDIGVVEGENKKMYKEFGEVEEEEKEEEEKGGSVSICVPPKNALLLMRCRSDPVKMAALANRFWESPVHKDQVVVDEDEDEDENEDNEGEVVEEAKEEEGGEKEHIEMEEDDEEEERKSICESEIEDGLVNIEENLVIQLEEAAAEEEETEPEVKESCEIESKVTNFESNDVHHEPNQDKEIEVNEEGEENNEREGEEGSVIIHQDENFSCDSNSTLEVHHHADLEKEEIEELEPSLKNMKEEQENEGSSKLYPTPAIFIASELQNNEAKAESESEAIAESESAANEEAESEAIAEAETNEEAIAEAESEVTATMAEPEAEEQEEKVTVTAEILSPEHEAAADPTHEEPDQGQENGTGKEEKEGLPECLLLMMCEPKLSMEVSKETWVCSTDFVRWLPPERLAGKTDGAVNERRFSLGSKPKRPSPQRFLQPPRSSCSIPAATATAGLGGLAGMIEQKLVGSKGSSNCYEPFVLTRCKSEPVRSSAKLAPLEACFWKDRKLEPATLGVGAPAGVGF